MWDGNQTVEEYSGIGQTNVKLEHCLCSSSKVYFNYASAPSGLFSIKE